MSWRSTWNCFIWRKTRWIRLYSDRRGQKRHGTALWKPAAFTLLVGSSTYIVSICYHEMKRKSFLKKHLNEEHYSSLHNTEKNGISAKLKQIKQWWQYQLYHDKFYFAVLSLNACVFAAWILPQWTLKPFERLNLVLMRYFTSTPRFSSTSSLLLSSFSHKDVWHFMINMYVMYTFMPPFISLVGREGSWPYYLTAATFASAISHYIKVFRGAHLVASLGASGALLAVLSLVVMHNPGATLHIVFFPFIPIPASAGLASIVALDVIGLLRGWKTFDHAAHLAGTAFGILYYHYGHKIYHRIRRKVIQVLNYFS
ncbi:PREDICTED: presenilins-associated rhomboid-like protein, mitochondrial isoform X2 [Amphimedon queenslandica]|uniref:rhomboid protease n=1 Tax=Amphimedon queenslandica TaxID=400682 RepID=A0A1X7VQC1_AMPQE|nr:PREDICTED: presenilins-associated rhomboid-like protein, mitochondrial isoform X2 [Amphimedon queenslandica]|eukprot:XP_019858131.1 PREDICTED: presenilins-associated rhomboid-like protein, mitochondrial isoform X2 [Amphimedon queenslandica]